MAEWTAGKGTTALGIIGTSLGGLAVAGGNLLEDLLPQRKGSPVSLLGGAAVRYLAAKADKVYTQLRAIPALAAVGMIDGDMLDVDGIYSVLCEQMEHDVSTTIPIPYLGALTLKRPDIDAMYRRIQAS